MDNTVLEIKDICKSYVSGEKKAVSHVSFSMEKGSLLALVGQSGSGKTTLLRIMAGLEQPDAGSVSLGGNVIVSGNRSIPPHERGIGLLFQDYALFPHLTVFENIAFGLKGLSNQEKSKTVNEMLELVNLTVEYNRYPHELSGGQQQRVALARAIAPRPSILLLDEPFSNLDAILREQVREEIKQIVKRTGISTILVTHDVKDALSTADQIAVMHQGELLQIGDPQSIYDHPINDYVAKLFGKYNVLDASFNDGDVIETAFGEMVCRMPDACIGSRECLVCFRPEQAVLAQQEIGEGKFLTGTVQACSFSGDKWTICVQPVGAEKPLVYLDRPANSPLPGIGEQVYFKLVRYGIR